MSTVSGIGIRYADQPNSATSAASIVGGTNSKRSSPASRRTSGSGGTGSSRRPRVPSCTHGKCAMSTKFSTRRAADVGHVYGAPVSTLKRGSSHDGCAGTDVGAPAASRTHTSPCASSTSNRCRRGALGDRTAPGATGCRCSGRRRRSTTRGWRSGARRRRPSPPRAGSTGAGSDRPPPPRRARPASPRSTTASGVSSSRTASGCGAAAASSASEHTGCQQWRSAASRSGVTVPGSARSTNCQRARALRSCELTAGRSGRRGVGDDRER